jgi:tripartite-type tricarboxylate transporter receptor subunit TctC
VPARTPPAIIARLNQELVQILNRPDNADALLKQGQEVWTTTPEAFGAHMQAEYKKWGTLIRELRITAD